MDIYPYVKGKFRQGVSFRDVLLSRIRWGEFGACGNCQYFVNNHQPACDHPYLSKETKMPKDRRIIKHFPDLNCNQQRNPNHAVATAIGLWDQSD